LFLFLYKKALLKKMTYYSRYYKSKDGGIINKNRSVSKVFAIVLVKKAKTW